MYGLSDANYKMNTIKYESIGKIYDSTGKLIFTFPSDTELIKIPLDLWFVINYYCKDFILYVVGSYSKKYPGYHLMTQTELGYNSNLLQFYRTNNGILSIGNFKGGYIGGVNCELERFGPVKTDQSMIKYNDNVLFKDERNSDINFYYIAAYGACHLINVGLFMLDNS